MLNTANLEVIDLSKDEDEDDEDVGPVSASAPRPQHPPSRPPSYFTTNEDNKMPLEQMQDHLDQQYVGIRDPPRKSLAHEIPDTLPFLPPRQPDATNANTTIPQILDLTRNTQQQLNEMASQSMRLHPFSFDSSLLEDPPGALQDRLAIFSGQKRAEQLGLIRKGANTAAPASLPSSTVPPPVHLAKAVVEEVVNQHGGNGNDDDEDYDDGEIQLTSSSS